MQEAAPGTRRPWTDLLTKIKAAGKRGMLVEADWFDICGLDHHLRRQRVRRHRQGGLRHRPEGSEVLEWMFQQLNDETVTYGGALPKGQEGDALFYAGQVATVQFGRWVLPNLKKLKSVEYDIAPMPSESGKDICPGPVYMAAMSVNAKAKDIEGARRSRASTSAGGPEVPAVRWRQRGSVRHRPRRGRDGGQRARRMVRGSPSREEGVHHPEGDRMMPRSRTRPFLAEEGHHAEGQRAQHRSHAHEA